MSIRKRAGAFVVDSGFALAARMGRLDPRARAAFRTVEHIRDIPYRDTGHAAHRLDVYLPTEGSPPYPMVFYVHGGGFRILSKDTHWLFGLIFARRGYVLFNVSYRLAPRHPFPAAIEDVGAAYRWVTNNATRFGADPNRTVLAGESAGANLVTSLAISRTFERTEPFAKSIYEHEPDANVRAVVAMCGMHQVSDASRFTVSSQFVRDRLEEVPEAYLGVDPLAPPASEHALADPLLILEGEQEPSRELPPFLLSVGTRDPLQSDTERLAAALDKRGVEHDTHIYEHEPHAFQAFLVKSNARLHWRRTFTKLSRLVT